ncbi:MAG TPA: PadR family transcriptional regulator [Acidobacteriota bacterium]|nr:PadR family transcriptional regulator [Acidobacteriota bacterium]
MTRKNSLGEFEQMVMLAVLQLDEEAFGPGISRLLEERAGRGVSRGALYSSLDRLERKGFLTWSIASPTSERGGYRKRLFSVTEAGLEALREARQAMDALYQGLDHVFQRGSR